MPLLMTLEGPRVQRSFLDRAIAMIRGHQQLGRRVNGGVSALTRVRTNDPLGLGLNSFWDPIALHPVMLFVGLGVGIWLGSRRKRR